MLHCSNEQDAFFTKGHILPLEYLILNIGN